MTPFKPSDDTALGAAFKNARETPVAVPDALMSRVLADAVAEMPKVERHSIWHQFVGALGGWPAMAGLAATACVGLWAGGTLSEDLIWTFGVSETAALESGVDLGPFDLLLVDG